MVAGFQEAHEHISQHPNAVVSNSLTCALAALIVEEELVVANAGTRSVVIASRL
jgi:hypothetical protein